MEKDPEKKNYPGGTFDPLGYSKDQKTFMTDKVKHIKNGKIQESALLIYQIVLLTCIFDVCPTWF